MAEVEVAPEYISKEELKQKMLQKSVLHLSIKSEDFTVIQIALQRAMLNENEWYSGKAKSLLDKIINQTYVEQR